MPRRRRREIVTREVEGSPLPPRRPPPWLSEIQWAGLALLALVAAGIVVWLVVRENDQEEAAPTTTVVETATTTATTSATTTEAGAVVVPELTGRQLAEATQAAASEGLEADSYPVESAEPRGTVVAQSPDAGTQASEGDGVRLNVSLGSGARADTTVPDVTGPEAPEARATLTDARLTVRTADRDAPEPDNVGEVILQDPDAGATVPELTQVTIYVGR